MSGRRNLSHSFTTFGEFVASHDLFKSSSKFSHISNASCTRKMRSDGEYPLQLLEQAMIAEMNTKSSVFAERFGPKIWRMFSSHAGVQGSFSVGCHSLRIRAKVAKQSRLAIGSFRLRKIFVDSSWKVAIRSLESILRILEFPTKPSTTSYKGRIVRTHGSCAIFCNSVVRKSGILAGTAVSSGRLDDSIDTQASKYLKS